MLQFNPVQGMPLPSAITASPVAGDSFHVSVLDRRVEIARLAERQPLAHEGRFLVEDRHGQTWQVEFDTATGGWQLDLSETDIAALNAAADGADPDDDDKLEP